jgi:hypothetical protein
MASVRWRIESFVYDTASKGLGSADQAEEGGAGRVQVVEISRTRSDQIPDIRQSHIHHRHKWNP